MNPIIPATFGHWQGLDNDSQESRYALITKLCQPATANGYSVVLDVGAGTGVLGRRLGLHCFYRGIDANPHAVNKRIEDVRLATAEDYQPVISYDAIVFNEMLYYCKDPVGLISKYRRYLNPRGKIIISIFRRPGAWSAKAWIKSILWPSQPFSNEQCHRIVSKFLKTTGWRIEEQVVREGMLVWDVISAMP